MTTILRNWALLALLALLGTMPMLASASDLESVSGRIPSKSATICLGTVRVIPRGPSSHSQPATLRVAFPSAAARRVRSTQLARNVISSAVRAGVAVLTVVACTVAAGQLDLVDPDVVDEHLLGKDRAAVWSRRRSPDGNIDDEMKHLFEALK